MDEKSKDACLKLARPIFSIVMTFVILASFFWVPGSTANSVYPKSNSYIIQGNDLEGLARLVNAVGGRVTSRLPVIHALGASLPEQAAARLQAEPAVTRIFPNGYFQAANNGIGLGAGAPNTDFPHVVGADAVWAGGVTGANVTVAVVDTGLSNQQALKHRIAGWVDFVDGYNQPKDPNGHGTHVGGIIAGDQTTIDGEWTGVAPGADLVGVRVLDASGFGTYEQVIRGIQWVIDHKDQYNIQVMNLSLVSPARSPYWADPLNQAVMQAWAAGITVVAASGNGGPGPETVGVPGNNPYVITVGAFTDHFTPNDSRDDYLAAFSAAGPTLDGFVKPDVVAPGAHIVSAMMPSAYLSRLHAANRVNSQYFSMAGTSQATGIVSGIAALVLSANPGLSPDQVKQRILAGSAPWLDPATGDAPYSIWQQGYGRVDAPAAVWSAITDSANAGLDVRADLDGSEHFQGYSYFDALTGKFRLRGSPDSQYLTWNGSLGSWSGGLGSWSGGLGSWSGGLGSWSGGLGSWSGGMGSWSGGLGSWSGGLGSWSGSISPVSDLDVSFGRTGVTIDRWVEEP